MKPHLRNLFFRTSALLALDIKPLFVLDGSAPELKRNTLAIRSQSQSLGAGCGSSWGPR